MSVLEIGVNKQTLLLQVNKTEILIINTVNFDDENDNDIEDDVGTVYVNTKIGTS